MLCRSPVLCVALEYEVLYTTNFSEKFFQHPRVDDGGGQPGGERGPNKEESDPDVVVVGSLKPKPRLMRLVAIFLCLDTSLRIHFDHLAIWLRIVNIYLLPN